MIRFKKRTADKTLENDIKDATTELEEFNEAIENLLKQLDTEAGDEDEQEIKSESQFNNDQKTNN